MSRDGYFPFYGWLLINGVIVFGAYLLWVFGLFGQLVQKDVTYLSAVILGLFLMISLYLGFAAWALSRQFRFASHVNHYENASGSLSHDYLNLLEIQRQQASQESEPLLARLVEQVHRGHATGWFFSDLLMRLGLIGTVIGFVIMLGSVYQLKENDVQALQQLLGTMGSGMQVALYTTLTGLGTAILLSIQCQWLDYCADGLVSRIIKLGVKTPQLDSQV